MNGKRKKRILVLVLGISIVVFMVIKILHDGLLKSSQPTRPYKNNFVLDLGCADRQASNTSRKNGGEGLDRDIARNHINHHNASNIPAP
jgi:hypothetical protein